MGFGVKTGKINEICEEEDDNDDFFYYICRESVGKRVRQARTQ